METNFTKPIDSPISPINSLDSAETLPSAPPNLSCNLSDNTLPGSELSNSDKYLNGSKIDELELNPSDFIDLDPLSSVSPRWNKPCQEIENHKATEVEVEVQVEFPLSLSVGAEIKEVSSESSLHPDPKLTASYMALPSQFRPSPVGAGLTNLGNTCFFNAVMQCFTHTSLLLIAIISSGHKCPCYAASAQKFCVLCALIDHINLSMTYKVFAPWFLVNNLKYFSTYFDRYQQEDAHEFLQCFLGKLNDCWIETKINDKTLQGSNIVHQIFGGRLVSKLRCCNCGHCSDTYEPLIDVSLEIENADSLSGALESFTQVEKIEDSETKFTCEGCNKQVFVEKQLMLDQTPSIAAFHLKRFKNNGCYVEKIDKFVSFPLELDLDPYTAGYQSQIAELKYELYAVVVHLGNSSNSGHYYCFIRSSPGVWYKLDDDLVIWVDEKFVLSQEAYILFYAKQGAPSFSKFVEMQKLAIYIRNNTSPKSVLVNIDGCSSSSTLALECQIEKPEESGDNEYENKENFMPLSTPYVVTSSSSSPVAALPLNDSDSILKENNSSHVSEVMNHGNVTPPPKSKRSTSPEIFKEDSDQHFSIPRGYMKSADQVSCKRQYFSIPDGGSKSADQVSCKRQLNRELESVELKQACALIKKRMPGSRGQQLLAALGGSLSEGSTNKKRARPIHQFPDTEDKNTRQKGTGQSNAAGSFR